MRRRRRRETVSPPLAAGQEGAFRAVPLATPAAQETRRGWAPVAFEEEETIDWSELVFGPESTSQSRRSSRSLFASRRRNIRDSSRFVLKTSAKLIVPLFLVVVWAAVVFLVAADGSARTRAMLHRSTLAKKYAVSVVKMQAATKTAARRGTVAVLDGMGSSMYREPRTFFIAESAYLGEIANTLMKGGPSWVGQDVGVTSISLDPLEAGSVLYEINMVDGCKAASTVQHLNYTCAGAYRATGSRALYDLTVSIVSLYRNAFSTGTFEAYDALQDVHYAYAAASIFSTDSINSVLEESAGELRSFQDQFQLLAVTAFLTFYTLFTVLVYWPSVSRRMGMLRHAKELLLAIPEQLVLTLPKLKESIREIATSDWADGDSAREAQAQAKRRARVKKEAAKRKLRRAKRRAIALGRLAQGSRTDLHSGDVKSGAMAKKATTPKTGTK